MNKTPRNKGPGGRSVCIPNQLMPRNFHNINNQKRVSKLASHDPVSSHIPI